MPAKPDAVLHRAVCEIRYKDGLVYLDCCGSLTNELLATVGAGYSFSLPRVEEAIIASGLERAAIKFGPLSCSTTFDGLETPARFWQVTRDTWKVVGSKLDTRHKVTRAGVRYWWMWETESEEEASQILRDLDIAKVRASWSALFGVPEKASFTTEQRWNDKRYRVRLESGKGERKEPNYLPDDLLNFFPEAFILLDVDYWIPTEDAGSLSNDALKDLLTESYQHSKDLVAELAKRIVQ